MHQCWTCYPICIAAECVAMCKNEVQWKVPTLKLSSNCPSYNNAKGTQITQYLLKLHNKLDNYLTNGKFYHKLS